MINRTWTAAVAIAAAGLLAAAPASAGIVTYTLNGQLDGSIGASGLADTPFTWSFTANNLAPLQVNGFPSLQVLSTSISLGGVGTASFLQPVYAFQNAGDGLFAVIDQAVTDGVGWTLPAIPAGGIGAGFGPEAVDFAASIGSFQTDLGAFQVNSASNLSFSAVVAPSPPLVYTLTGAVSGTLDGVAFVDDPFSWTVTADTTNLVSHMDFPALPTLGGIIHLDGLGDVTAASDFQVVERGDDSAAGFLDAAGTQGFAFGLPQFPDYRLGDALNDISVSFIGAAPIQTSGGLLDISGASGLRLSAVALSAVPEPSAWALLILGFAGAGAILRRRRAPEVQARSIRAA